MMPKIIISPGQGLLLLIQYYNKQNDNDMVDRLKKFYFIGAQNEDEEKEIKKLLNHTLIAAQGFDISYEMEVITKDPTRRFFETLFVYYTLQNNLHLIETEDLDDYFSTLDELLTLNWENKNHLLEQYKQLINGNYKQESTTIQKEYADYINKLNKHTIFTQFDLQQIEKIKLMIQSSLPAIILAGNFKLPLDLYDKGLYKKENRGVIKKSKSNISTKNIHFGTLLGHMPVPYNHKFLTAHKALPYLKPSDKVTYNEQSQWMKLISKYAVHPFVNSLSGTILAQLRNILELIKQKKAPSFAENKEQFELFMRLYISALIYNGGGHSLFECVYPITIKETQDEFSSISDFKQINMESIFLTNNTVAFNDSIKKTIEYNNIILLRKKVQEEIKDEQTIEFFKKNSVEKRLKKELKLYQQELKEPNKNDNNIELEWTKEELEMLLKSVNDTIDIIDKNNDDKLKNN
jgi:hypothetical protein